MSTLNSIFGGARAPKPDPADEVAVLREQLREAEETIEHLRRALGSNHLAGAGSAAVGCLF